MVVEEKRTRGGREIWRRRASLAERRPPALRGRMRPYVAVPFLAAGSDPHPCLNGAIDFEMDRFQI